jgi:hypothetical protein
MPLSLAVKDGSSCEAVDLHYDLSNPTHLPHGTSRENALTPLSDFRAVQEKHSGSFTPGEVINDN